jgi:hypothetical protein
MRQAFMFVLNPSLSARHAACSAIALVLISGWSMSSFAVAQGTAPRERKLAPGVLTTIPPPLSPDDTVSTHDLVEIRSNPALEWSPEFLAASDTLHGKSSAAKFRRNVWGLEFSFKPLRMIEVDIPQRNGTVERKPVWYLVYRVRNTGQVLQPVEGEGGVYTASLGKGGPVRFVPEFVLESHDRDASGQRVRQSYVDRVIPAAVEGISRRERLGDRLLHSAEMSERPIPVSDGRIDRGVWGVATWIDIDPRMDFFSIYVGGLTNAYRWEDAPGAYRPGDPPGRGRRFAQKTLQLNFWRPGDERSPNEREFRYGVPLDNAQLYDVADGVAYRWLYR